jgi:hypothetical protein
MIEASLILQPQDVNMLRGIWIQCETISSWFCDRIQGKDKSCFPGVRWWGYFVTFIVLTPWQDPFLKRQLPLAVDSLKVFEDRDKRSRNYTVEINQNTTDLGAVKLTQEGHFLP